MGEAKRKRSQAAARFGELEALFENFGIFGRDPGFYDDPRFLEAEQENPRFLENYAEWVWLRERPADYDRVAGHIVPILAELVFADAKASGQRGVCVDVSNLLSRCLDRLGVWNYIAVGALNVGLNGNPQQGRQYLWPFDELDPGAGQLGHLWVVAPPFQIVDVSIKLQGWPPAFQAAMPDFLASEKCRSIRMTVEDMVANEYLHIYAQQHGGHIPSDLHFRIRPDLREFERRFPGTALATEDTDVRYLPTGIRASDLPLEEAYQGGGVRFWNENVATRLLVDPIET